ncbi:uncharacterized protein LY79DRAFT_563237 [Colletotrichum navitas]|uniref:Uncharacterized protein n=1 Tax=Colletotrichum navitas TaxID=681940 RepID=A0AAD8PTV0_9PEZI|nr:uncharacterized protein LY79DRAFT_563237 [Colletotrichum navitas]KAK1579902.1 hypothetical protein LY79DRAFT_563237 [Colletotrichum navitas]
MYAQGDTARPVKVASLSEYHAERWLPSGPPYEYTSRLTVAPPADLLESFSELVSGIGVLGLYHIDTESGGKMIERTEGRMNSLSPYDGSDGAESGDHLETAWNLGKGDPVTMAKV